MADGLDPEARALFRKIAADPRSVLMRIPRSTRRRANAPAVEGHLSRVHREEAAALLRGVFAAELVADERAGHSFQDRVSAEVTIPPRMEPEEFARSWNSLSELPSRYLNGPGRDALYPFFGRGLLRPSLLQVALAAYRLVPGDASRIQVALECLRVGRPAQATDLLGHLLARGCAAAVEPHAWEALGLAHATTARPDRVLACFSRAARLAPGRFPAAMSLLALAIRLGDRDRILAEARRVDDLLDADHPAVVRFATSLVRRAAAGEWGGVSRAYASVRDRLGPASARIALALEGARSDRLEPPEPGAGGEPVTVGPPA